MAVELYHFWSSVCSVRCRMALEEKGVAWTSRYIGASISKLIVVSADGVRPMPIREARNVDGETAVKAKSLPPSSVRDSFSMRLSCP